MEENKSENQQKEKAVKIPENYKPKIKGWESKFGKVKPMAILDGDEPRFLFFRKPTRPELSAAESLVTDADGNIDLYAKAEKMMTDCYLGGDVDLKVIFDDVDLFMPIAKRVLYELVAEKKTIWINS